MQAYSGLHAISPILFGLSVPCLAIGLFAPRSMVTAQTIAVSVLVVVALAATIVFALSLFAGGRIAGIVVDPSAQVVELVSTSTFARRVESIPFQDVSTLRQASHYDRDGYKSVTTELVLRSGEVITLPISPSESELRAVRGALVLR